MPDDLIHSLAHMERVLSQHKDMEIKNMYMSFDMKLDPNTFIDSTETGTGGSKTWDAVYDWKYSYIMCFFFLFVIYQRLFYLF